MTCGGVPPEPKSPLPAPRVGGRARREAVRDDAYRSQRRRRPARRGARTPLLLTYLL